MFIEFLTSYLIEVFLSLDNIFIFIVIFKYMNIKQEYHSKLLFIGIVSTILFRLITIIFGLLIINFFYLLLLPLSIFFLYSSFVFFRKNEKNKYNSVDMSQKLLKNFNYYNKDKKKLVLNLNNKFCITKIGLALLMIEKADLLFTIDSISIILAITYVPFIIFSSNLLSVVGLRSIYFSLEKNLKKFKYLNQSIGFILLYMGIKIIMSFFNIHIINEILITLTVITFLIFFIFSYLL